MPPLFRLSPSHKRLAACLLVAATAIAQPANARPAASDKKPNSPAPEITEKQADLSELRGRIESLRKDIASSEDDKADAAGRLRTIERDVTRLRRELLELAEQRGKLQERLNQLEAQSRELGSTLAHQQSQLERLLYLQYLRGTPDTVQMLLNGDDPNQMARDLRYFSAIAQTRADMMSDISSTLERKKALAADAKERAAELAEIEAQQQKRHADLQKQLAERQALYAKLAEKVKSQKKEMGNLQQDEKRLSNLIDRLSKLLAQQAAKAAEAARAAKAAEAARVAEAARQHEKKSRPADERPGPRPAEGEVAKAKPAVEAENRYEPVASSGAFERQRGSLRLPVRGNVTGRFGTPRDGGGTWRGLFIRAGNGSEVKAIAAGRVVFADWMRGFGNLLILDHGDGYLSIYGNNEAMLKQVGQNVRGGETIASVGNSGGNPESGLYFELRHQGQPVDPMKWASLK